MRERTFWRKDSKEISPSKTSTEPFCIFLTPAIKAKSVDFPTPSGPIKPTVAPRGISKEIFSRAWVFLYL